MPKTRLNRPRREQLRQRIKQSSAYTVAYDDLEFLHRDALRPVRLQLELLKTEMTMRQHGIDSTIVVFGGTRILEPAAAARQVRAIERKLRRSPGSQKLKKDLAVARSIREKAWYYDEAREFARLASRESQKADRREYVIMTGGGPGIMEAANRGAWEVNAKSIGLNITLPMEQEPNPYIDPELCLQFHYFAIRKMHFLLRAKALVAFPGGYGTLDELFEALTLVQTNKVKPLPIVLFGERFWRRVIDFDYLVSEGTIAPEDMQLFVYADKAADAWNYIKYFYRANGNHRRRPAVSYF